MKIFSITLLVILLVSANSFGQQIDRPNTYSYYLDLLGSSKDVLYDSILHQFDQYIAQNPGDYKVSIERCRLIENAYYDSYEDYNPNYDEAVACVDTLIANFPTEPEVLLLKVDYLYGEELTEYLRELNDGVPLNDNWDSHAWKLYKLLAENYENESNYEFAIRFGNLAKEQKDSLDLTLMMGRLYKEQNNTAQAIEVLSSSIDTLDLSWELNQKGKLLLELGAPDKAIEAFRLAKRDSTGWQDQSALAQALMDKGLYTEAREYLAKEVSETTWNKEKALRKLFVYDLTYGSLDSAKVAYRELVELNFMSDPIGIDRIRLFFKAPLFHWTFDDILHILLLLLILFVLLIFPYLWILPIHYIGNYFRTKGMQLSASEFRWGLRHFWIICSGYLIISVVAVAIVDYPTIISMFDESIVYGEVTPEISKANATLTLLFCSGLLVMTIFLLKRTDLRLFWGTLQSKGRAIGVGIGVALLLKVGLGIYAAILRFADISLFEDSALGMLSINDDIISVNQFYHPLLGFLMVVIIVPIYEEILFRGVLLSACEKHMKFWIANSLQAVAFALVHQELKLIPFYFAFAFVCGYYRNKTQSLATGISLHVTNNLLAFIGILIFQARMG